MNPTNDPALRSFIPVPEDSHFPIQNLPYGVFTRREEGRPHIGVAIGDQILDLTVLAERGKMGIPAPPAFYDLRKVFEAGTLNPFLAMGRAAWSATRGYISWLLHENSRFADDLVTRKAALVPQSEVTMRLPVDVGDYTDFYSSREHATNVGTMLRGADKALMPNWLHLPVAYHGRSSSLVVGGTDVRRPKGQYKPDGADAPVFGPSRSLDFELETGVLVGPGNALGRPVPVGEAEDHLFGMVLVNDWSARDIQAWEYVPLGPFLAKNFATSVSPWVVPLEALEPFRTAGPAQDPEPLPYLRQYGPHAYDIRLEARLQTPRLDRPHTICSTNFKHLYWSMAQQLAHHTVNGCNLRPGDLLASGTVSGPTPDSLGCLLELTWRGARPLTLPSGEQRTFLQDGDRLTLTGWCQGDGYRVGFGEVTGQILPAE
jgi:fumarylacetoacetase